MRREIDLTVQMRRLIGIYTLLLAGNAGAWLWAHALFGSNTILIGSATLAYLLGLRHAVDADHIAAIDNVTRKLVHQRKDPVTVGLYFSLGHSTVVTFACGMIVFAAAGLHAHFGVGREIFGLIGTGVSASFLFIIALVNSVTLFTTWRAVRGQTAEGAEVRSVPLGPFLRPFLSVIASPWQMYPLGFLFGLGFDTASEVGLLSVSASAAGQVGPLWSIMVFPALFTAGMTLVDTTDGLLMKAAYGWALVRPQRELAYNITITLVSIAIAILVGGLEVLGLLEQHFGLRGLLWRWVSALNGHFSAIGCTFAAVLASWWFLSAMLFRQKGRHLKSSTRPGRTA